MSAVAEAFRDADVKGWSNSSTLRTVAGMVADLDWESASVVDVGAGRGSLSRLLGETLKSTLGREPSQTVFACDLIPDSFEYGEIACAATLPEGRLPFDDESFDATISVEVIEHVEDQFAFLRELARVTRPGGRVIVTTPNTLNANSRLRTLCSGFPVLFDPLPLSRHDPRRLGGHIHPISPYFLAYGALRAGLIEPTLHVDRTKRSAVCLSIALFPLLVAGRLTHRARLARKHPEVLAENRSLLDRQESWPLLTSRTAILQAIKPREPARAEPAAT